MNPEVDLVGITKPSAITGCETAQQFIVWCARVSNPSNQSNTETAPKLIRYLLKHKHFSPFEMVNVSFRITTTRDIARQIIRHKSFSFQEYSQRYADPTSDLDFVTREARLQDPKNRQNSIDVEDRSIQEKWNMIQKEIIENCTKQYKWAIHNGIAKEQARAVLPEGCTKSVVIVSGSVRSWIHYVEVRTDISTQKEHREIAILCRNIISHHFPDIAKALEWPIDG